MSRHDTSIQEQLKLLNWSIDDLLTYAIIASYEKLEDSLNEEFPGASNKRLRKKLKHERIKNIPITRQTIYNVIRGEHKTKESVAMLIRDTINYARRQLDSHSIDLDFSELDIAVYDNKRK